MFISYIYIQDSAGRVLLKHDFEQVFSKANRWYIDFYYIFLVVQLLIGGLLIKFNNSNNVLYVKYFLHISFNYQKRKCLNSI